LDYWNYGLFGEENNRLAILYVNKQLKKTGGLIAVRFFVGKKGLVIRVHSFDPKLLSLISVLPKTI